MGGRLLVFFTTRLFFLSCDGMRGKKEKRMIGHNPFHRLLEFKKGGGGGRGAVEGGAGSTHIAVQHHPQTSVLARGQCGRS